MATTDPRAPTIVQLPLSPKISPKISPKNGNGQGRKDVSSLSPPSKRNGKQPTLREPIDSIVSETSFVTNPYAAGGPVATPSPGPPLNAPPGLNPIPIPQPSSFILPPLNFVPLANGYFQTASTYATQFLPGSHPLRLSVALEHSAFLWDCLHDHEGSRRVARRAIKDVYRAQEAMDDTEFEDAAELVGILGKMMKRKSWEGTPRVGGMGSPEPVTQAGANARVPVTAQQSPQSSRRVAEATSVPESPTQAQSRGATRSRATSTAKSSHRQKDSGSHENTPRADTQRFPGGVSQETTPRARHTSVESGASTTPRAPQGVGGRSPATPSTVRASHQPSGSGGSRKGNPVISNSPITPSSAARAASDAIRHSPSLRRSPPSRSPKQESPYTRQQR